MDNPFIGRLHAYISFSHDEESVELGDDSGQITPRHAAYAAHAINQHEKLVEALEQIRDAETECCPRCEGNGKLYADGRGHYTFEGAATVLCGRCGGGGRLQPDNAQEIAAQALDAEEAFEKKMA